jgi:hypothetical protein
VPDLDVRLLQEQISAAAERIVELPRHPRGYQGLISVEDVIVVVAVRGEDGQVRYVDPAEVNDGKPDCFVRDYVRIPNGRRGTSVVELLQRFLPVFAPKVAGWFDWFVKKVGR